MCSLFCKELYAFDGSQFKTYTFTLLCWLMHNMNILILILIQIVVQVSACLHKYIKR